MKLKFFILSIKINIEYAYAFNAKLENNAEWPGVAMEK